MARLRIYTVHIHPALAHPYEAAEFISEGFSWKAFFFTGLWALYHRLWWAVGAFFLYNAALLSMVAADDTLSTSGLWIIDLSVRILVGFEGRQWLRNRLQTRGYITADIVTGDSLLRAEQRYFDRYFAMNPNAPV